MALVAHVIIIFHKSTNPEGLAFTLAIDYIYTLGLLILHGKPVVNHASGKPKVDRICWLG